MKLSIIVPVYNTEEYIVRCISSLLRQDFDDYEIIIVNDGTTDHAMEVLDRNVSSDKIIVRNQENGGQSLARNEGLKLAHGDYVWFVDSDDWINDNCLKDICFQLGGCDILYFNQYYKSTCSSESIKTKMIEAETGAELCKKDILVGPHFYIIRRGFLTQYDYSFPVGLYHEDNLYIPTVLYKAQVIKSYQPPVYHNYYNPHSTTNIVNPKRCYDLMTIAERLKLFAETKVTETDSLNWGGHFISDTMNGALALSLKCEPQVRHDLGLFVGSHRDLLKYLCYAPKMPTRIMGWLSYYLHIPIVPLYQFLSVLRYKNYTR